MKFFKSKNYKLFLLSFLSLSCLITGIVFAADERTASEIRSEIITLAKGQLGNPYIWGGSTPYGSDCSGFMNYTYSTTGVATDQLYAWGGTHGLTVTGQYALCDPIAIDALLPGDFLFEKGWRPNGTYGFAHVGMYIGGGRTIEAANPSLGIIECALSRWTDPTVVPWNDFFGAGRLKAEYWPNGDNGGSPDDIIIGPIPPGPIPPGPTPPGPIPPGPTPPSTGEHSFGGFVTNVYNCSCTGNHLLTIDNLSTEGPRPVHLIYQPGASVVYENNQIPVSGVWLNGLWENGGDSCVGLTAVSCGDDGLSTCYICSDVRSSDGTVTFTGTSN